MGTEIVERLEVDTDRTRSSGASNFLLHYQPVFRLDSGAIAGVEALVRWRHPDRGLLLPADFIPIAERSGHIMAIDHWVLREASRSAASWAAQYPEHSALEVGVNLSAVQLQTSDAVDEVSNALADAGLDPRQLILEITETAVIEDVSQGIETLNGLKELGVQLAVDDFGTGYASPEYLQHFPIDVLKIDKSFVDGLGASADGSAAVGAIVDVAQSFSLRVVAEGIELPDQRALLLELGCELGQGYEFSRPVDREEMEAMLSSAQGTVPSESRAGTP
jgi:EAL domain-containing protein (putative c-di-GMP-specific phosphodiesterase class I)